MKEKRTSPFLIAASLVIVVAGMMEAQSILLPILLSIFISIVCTQPIVWLTRHKVPYTLSVLIVLVGMLLIFFGFGGLIGESLSRFYTDVPKYEDKLQNIISGLSEALGKWGIDFNPNKVVKVLDPNKILNFTANMVGQIGNIMSNSFLILFITIFILFEIKTFALKTEVIKKNYTVSLDYLNKIGNNIRHYLSIKTIISLITGILIAIWLLIIGVDYPVLWGVIAFLLNYIPSIGSIIAAVPTMLLAVVQLGVGGMIWTGVGYLVVNTVMGNIVEPKVMGKGLGLSTLVVFLSLIVWGFIFGSVGMFLSVPLTMAIKIVLEQNKNTRWFAVIMGTEEETKQILQQSGKNDKS